MHQQTLADGDFDRFRKKALNERFLDDTGKTIPWQDTCIAIEPYYPKSTGTGRRPAGIESMLRKHLLKNQNVAFRIALPDRLQRHIDHQACSRIALR